MELSVRFFKRLILLILALLIIIPIVTSILLRISLGKAQAQVKDTEHQLELTQEQLNALLEGEDLAGYILPEKSDGTPLDVLNTADALPYQKLFPELYSSAELSIQRVKAANTVYLTFDGGPSENTAAILEALDAAQVKATFFVSVHEMEEDAAAELLCDIRDKGHTIGIYSYSNDFLDIYQSVDDYLTDFNRVYEFIYEATGVKAEIFRFPGGSVNSYNSGIYQSLIGEMLRRGFAFYDWNATGGDTLKGANVESVVRTVKADMNGKSRGIVLLHDTNDKAFVAQALPSVISMLKEQGYTFEPLAPSVLPIVFSYKSQT